MTGLLAQILATLQNSTPIIVSTEPQVKTQTIQASEAPPAAVDANSVEFNGKVYTRDGNAKFWLVLDHLRANPDAASLSLRKLEAQTGISKTICEQAKRA